MEFAKRSFDIIFSTMGMIILLPLIPVIGLLIKIDSKGPVFYFADRVGKDMVPFKMYKFRTMAETSHTGYSVCAQYDPRVTFFGGFLRRTKLNELPQLFNIFTGEMTFVGPRPEAPDLAELYPLEGKKVFTVKPGLVGPASISGRNEEECYPPGVDEKKYYIEHILPNKLKLDLAYIDDRSFFKDIIFVFDGVKTTIQGAVNRRHISDNKSQIFLLATDVGIILTAYAMASAFIGNSEQAEGIQTPTYMLFYLYVVLVHAVSNIYFGMYSSLIRYISYNEVKNVILACISSGLILCFSMELFNDHRMQAQPLLGIMAMLAALLSGLRLGLRFYWEKRRQPTEKIKGRRALLYGANDNGYRASRVLTSKTFGAYELIGFLDDNQAVFGKKINGRKVLGNRFHIKELVKLYHIEEILVAVDGTPSLNLDELIKICRDSNVTCRLLPHWSCTDQAEGYGGTAREFQLSDTLPLISFCANVAESQRVISGKNIFIIGGGSELGIELAHHVLSLGCKRLVIVDRYEAYLNRTAAAVLKKTDTDSVSFALMEDDAADQMEEMFKKFRPEIIFQLSIRKYEPLFCHGFNFLNHKAHAMTMDLARIAANYHCEFFVLISSSQNSTGGFSPVRDHLAQIESKLIRFFGDKSTLLVIPRLCDIAENRGGVLNFIEEQILNRVDILLPSARESCDLISKTSAVEFILHTLSETHLQPKENNIYPCDLGWHTTLMELARRAANFHGVNPLTDVKIHIVTHPEKHTGIQRQQWATQFN